MWLPFALALGVALGCLAGCAGGRTASPPPRTSGAAMPDARERDEAPASPPRRSSNDAAALARAFEARLTVHVRRDGTRVLARRCREGPVDCEARIAAFAAMLVDAAERHALDPWLLGALALRESGLDPSAVNRSGAAGILQLHPRGVGRGVRFVHDAGYRARCQAELEACQRPIVERGAAALARAVEECGSVESALGAYATGHCTDHARHAERVLEERARLEELGRASP